MTKKNQVYKIFIFLIPILAVGLVYIFRNRLYELGTLLPGCPSYTYFGIYCPGCGNTRSVQHLLEGDLTGSLRYNPVPVFAIILLVLLYAELVLKHLNKPVKLVPRSKPFWISVLVIFSIYYVIRNIVRFF